MITTLDESELDKVRRAAKASLGMDLTGMKTNQLERRVASFCQRAHIESVDDLVTAIGTDGAIQESFLDRLTINVTNLYRNPERWAYLEKEIMPRLAPKATIWSAGCSTGAEVYSLAIAAARTDVVADIIGSDIDQASLAKARRAVYSDDDMREVPQDIARRWFTPVDDGFEVDAQVRRRVRFERRDLLNDRPPVGSFDLVVCRNVVIYFNEEARDHVHRTCAARLRPGGILFVGNAERVNRPADMGLRAVSSQFYEKAA